MLVKVVERLVPTAVTPVMITTAIRAAIRPYSMAVAPRSFLAKANILAYINPPALISRRDITEVQVNRS